MRQRQREGQEKGEEIVCACQSLEEEFKSQRQSVWVVVPSVCIADT